MRLYGKRPVIERLKAAPQTIRALTIQQEGDASDLVRAAKAAGRTFDSVPKREFVKLAKDLHTQGVLAEVEEFRYVPLEELLKATEPRPILFLLDRITDPQNVGNILRTVACLGGIGLILPKHDSVEVNETVLRVACGAENYVEVARVTNLVQASEKAKKAGYWIAGAVASGGTPLPQVQWPWPIALVLGSEGGGIRPGLAKHLDLKVTLPMPGAALSFNVATAAALLAYEIRIRRQPA
jgi:23S rRNA (guanosine2251-2'-O)-methyltransferase